MWIVYFSDGTSVSERKGIEFRHVIKGKKITQVELKTASPIFMKEVLMILREISGSLMMKDVKDLYDQSNLDVCQAVESINSYMASRKVFIQRISSFDWEPYRNKINPKNYQLVAHINYLLRELKKALWKAAAEDEKKVVFKNDKEFSYQFFQQNVSLAYPVLHITRHVEQEIGMIDKTGQTAIAVLDLMTGKVQVHFENIKETKGEDFLRYHGLEL